MCGLPFRVALLFRAQSRDYRRHRHVTELETRKTTLLSPPTFHRWLRL